MEKSYRFLPAHHENNEILKKVSESTISHPGIISKIEGNKAEVTVIVSSGCVSCEIKSSCSISDVKSKIIEMELKNPELYFTGQDVTVEMKQSQGTLAVIFGYLIPFFVLVISLLIFILAGIDEGLAGLSALGMLVPYYFLLYLFRGSFQKKFSYRIV